MAGGSDTFKRIRDALKHVPREVKAYTAGGAALGGVSSAYDAHRQRKSAKTKGERLFTQHPIVAGLGGAVSGGFAGQLAGIGHHVGNRAGSRRAVMMPGVGAALGGVAGGVHGFRSAKEEQRRKKRGLSPEKKMPRSDVRGSVVRGAASGAMLGGVFGGLHGVASGMKFDRRNMKAKFRGKGPKLKAPPDWISGSGTKAEAKQKYRDLAKKWHPDKATNPIERAEHTRKFQNISAEWEDYQKSDHFSKLSMANLSRHVLKDVPQAAKRQWGWAKRNLRPRRVKAFIASHPEALASTGKGMAVGGGVGAIGGALREPDKQKKETRGKRALRGAVIGAALGGGLGHAFGRVQDEARKSESFSQGYNLRQNAKIRNYWAAEEAAGRGRRPLRDSLNDIWGNMAQERRVRKAKRGVKEFFGGGKSKISSLAIVDELMSIQLESGDFVLPVL